MRHCMWAAAVLALCFGMSADLSAQAGDADVVRQVLDAWQKRRKAMKAVTYKIDGVEIYAKGSMTQPDRDAHPVVRKDYPPKDVSFPKQVEYTIDFPGGKIRKEKRFHILNIVIGEFRPATRISLFDGKNAKVYAPRAENTSAVYTPSAAQPELILYKKGGKTDVLRQEDYPVLFAHGCPTLYNQAIDVTGYFDRPLEPSRFRFHQRGTFRDRGCLIVRSVPEVGRHGIFDEFWVDLERDGAILLWQAYERGTAYIRYEVSYRQVDQHWLPQSWQFNLFPSEGGRREFIRGERMKVTDIQIEPHVSRQTLSLPMKHGMVVSDGAGGDFVVASDDRTLVPYGQSTYVWRWWHWLGITLLGGALLGCLVYLLRRRIQAGS